LECAMDALARELRMDTLALRLKNYAANDQEKNRPYSDKRLDECYRLGAERFGWKVFSAPRTDQPRAERAAADNHRFKRGRGMASISWGAGGGPPSYASVRMNSDGTIDV